MEMIQHQEWRKIPEVHSSDASPDKSTSTLIPMSDTSIIRGEMLSLEPLVFLRRGPS